MENLENIQDISDFLFVILSQLYLPLTVRIASALSVPRSANAFTV